MPTFAVIRLTLAFARVNAWIGSGGNQAPCSSQPSVTSITIAWSFSTLRPNSTAIRATTVAGVSNSSRKIFSRQSNGPKRPTVTGARVRSYASAWSPPCSTARRSPNRPWVGTGVSQAETGKARSSSTNSSSAAALGSANRSTSCLIGSRE
jgi:hypothetical protein